MTAKTETPRTDAEEYSAIANTNSALLSNDKQYVVRADFARELELENVALCRRLEQGRPFTTGQVNEIDRLYGEVQSLRERLERTEKDTERLDLLSEHGHAVSFALGYRGTKSAWFYRKGLQHIEAATLREAIDAGCKEVSDG